MNQQLIEQYVAGKMSQADAEAFEVACLEDPQLARQVEFEQRLKAGLEQVARGSTQEFVRSDSGILRRLAVAASVLLFAIAAIYLWQRLPGQHPQILVAVAADAPNGAATMRLALVRGAGSLPQLPQGMVHVEVVGMFETDRHYSVTLSRPGRGQNLDTVASLLDQHPTSPTTLEILIDSSQLEPGTYSLRVRMQVDEDEALDFAFTKN